MIKKEVNLTCWERILGENIGEDNGRKTMVVDVITFSSFLRLVFKYFTY
jgi:hypothetical protein